MVEELPDTVPEWKELYDRAPMDSSDADTGGVLFHRCHPHAEERDFFAFAECRHIDIVVNTYYTKENGEKKWGTYTQEAWRKVINSYQARLGSYEDCPVCNEEVGASPIIREAIQDAEETQDVHSADETSMGAVIVFSNDNPRQWCHSVGENPYLDINYSEVNDDNNLVVAFESRYPRSCSIPRI